jgi:hypothetical protein
MGMHVHYVANPNDDMPKAKAWFGPFEFEEEMIEE